MTITVTLEKKTQPYFEGEETSVRNAKGTSGCSGHASCATSFCAQSSGSLGTAGHRPLGPSHSPGQQTLLEGHDSCCPLTGAVHVWPYRWTFPDCSGVSKSKITGSFICLAGSPGQQGSSAGTPCSLGLMPPPSWRPDTLLPCNLFRTPLLSFHGCPGNCNLQTEQRRKLVNSFVFCPENPDSLKHLNSAQ